MIWQEHSTDQEGNTIYAKVEDDGKIRITAVRGYPELDAYLEWVEAGNDPDEFWTQSEGEI
jgi:antitoxin component of MazEF toxin-antitoxin module